MGVPVDHLLKSISARELTEWMAYYEVEPFGEARDDLRMGIICSTIANVNRGKGGRVFKPEDFIPKFNKPKQQTWQEQLRIVEMLNVAFRGEDRRDHRAT